MHQENKIYLFFFLTLGFQGWERKDVVRKLDLFLSHSHLEATLYWLWA